MKRFGKIILAALIAALCLGALAACGKPGVVKLSYTLINEETEYEVRSAVGYANGVSEIPDTYKGKPVTKIGDRAFVDAHNFVALTVPESVKVIGSDAFDKCYGLTLIMKGAEPPAQNSSFDGIKYIIVPAAALETYKARWDAFKGIIYSDANAADGKYLVVGGELLSYFSADEKAEVPAAVTKINSKAFDYNEVIKEIAIPAETTEFDAYNGLSHCAYLTKITVASGNQTFAGQDGVMYDKAKTEIKAVPRALGGNVTVPSGVTAVGERFNGTKITGITLPDGVTVIVSNAFKGCSELKNVTLPAALTHIGASAFENCGKLTSITIPATVTEIGAGAFTGCNKLTIKVKIAENEKPAGWAEGWDGGRPVQWNA